jgi:protein-L-isoaspartate(D-aspartate) O-methyltransferase
LHLAISRYNYRSIQEFKKVDKMNFERARTAMVDSQVRPNAVTDFDIIYQMSVVPRERFVPAELQPLAYLDQHLELTSGRFMISPMFVAKLVQLAEIEKSDVVLDVACGYGYTAAIIAGLASSVVAIEESEDLANAATEALADLDIGNVAVMAAPLSDGYKKEAPFDVILIEGVVEQLPEALPQQLADGGRLVCVEPVNGVDTAVVYTKSGKTLSRREAFHAQIPNLQQFDRAEEFSL